VQQPEPSSPARSLQLMSFDIVHEDVELIGSELLGPAPDGDPGFEIVQGGDIFMKPA
jgi:hypothetical protein